MSTRPRSLSPRREEGRGEGVLADGDVALLGLLIVAGALPVVGDVLHGRPLGAEATIGALVALASLVGLSKRVSTHVRARALRRRLLPP